ncbi:unnamed protein product [Miscanthus lutarioriparius]|uniref:Peptidase C1A papain C-terminal domain-containing protein n=1 Tax=Miscanthus lutarioriparius TaxID=422564 RepID=A0A811RKD6_9POAL|nr:unnamed protein product [Miscanthus lutarioriparius]
MSFSRLFLFWTSNVRISSVDLNFSPGQGRVGYSTASGFGSIRPDGLPISVDWREAGALTEVSHQGDWCLLGCDGGSPYKAFEYIIANGGQVPYASYPYQGCQNQVIRPTKLCDESQLITSAGLEMLMRGF